MAYRVYNRQGYVATTDATVTTVLTHAVPTTTTVQITGTVTARRTGGSSGTVEDGAGYRIDSVLKNVSGTATEIAAETLTVVGEDQAGWTVTLAVSGGNALVQVTGAANNNISWFADLKIVEISS